MTKIENGIMRTTTNLPESALDLARKKVAEGDATLGEVIAESTYATLRPKPQVVSQSGIDLPGSTSTGGLRPGLSLDSNAELEDVMEGLV